MTKEELINLVRELNSLENLDSRQEDLAFLKREFKRVNNREEENFYEQQKANEFIEAYEELAKKVPYLTKSPVDEKREIIAKAEALLENGNPRTMLKEYEALFTAFKSAGRCGEELDNELFGKMRSIRAEMSKKVDAFYKYQRETFDGRVNAKKALIEEAKKALELENVKQAGEKLNDLMEQWKKVGFAGKSQDDALWEEFNAVRKAYSEKRKAFRETLLVQFQERAAKKETLIKEVKKITADAYWTNEEVKQIKDLQAEFRAVGFAGKDVDDDLYARFDAAVKQYFTELKFYKY